MSDPFLGEIRMFGGNYAPRGWAFCNGQIMSISQNSPLFAILGVTYGGNGQSTFALPNMQGRTPMHWGTGAGLSPHSLGEMSGTETVTLLSTQMPAHNHQILAANEEGNNFTPGGNTLAGTTGSGGNANTYFNGSPNTNLNLASMGVAGGNQPHSNMSPYLCVSFIIALQGIFPPRN